MNSIAARLLRIAPRSHFTSSAVGVPRGLHSRYSTFDFNGGNDSDGKQGFGEASVEDAIDDDIFTDKAEVAPQGVDPKRGWAYRGVHRAIICGKIGQAPVQKILKNGRTVTIFTVGTGGLYDQRTLGNYDLPKPAQWHRITVHNETLGTYAVQQLVKSTSVYVEGDIEIRVYNDSINGDVKNIPEICVRQDGRIRLIKSGESISSFSFDDLREGLS